MQPETLAAGISPVVFCLIHVPVPLLKSELILNMSIVFSPSYETVRWLSKTSDATHQVSVRIASTHR